MKILFTICGRGGSKGVPGKNTKEFCGYPLALYTLAAIELYIEKSGCKAVVAVNTDSEELRDILIEKKSDILAVKREEADAGDTASKLEVIAKTYKVAKDIKGEFDAVVDCDITSPLRSAEDIENIVSELFKREETDLCLSVCEARRSPYFNQLLANEQGYLERVIKTNFVARQQAPTIFDANASLYSYKPQFLMRENPFIFDGNVGFIKMKDTAVLDIDTADDFATMEILAKHYFGSYKPFAEVYEKVKTL